MLFSRCTCTALGMITTLTAGDDSIALQATNPCTLAFSVYSCSVLKQHKKMERHIKYLRCRGRDGDIDLERAIENARANLAAGKSPGAGLESAYDQADAAFADLIVTSVDDQGITLEEKDMKELAKSGTMEIKDTEKKGNGFLGDIAQLFQALSGGAHIIKREDGTL